MGKKKELYIKSMHYDYNPKKNEEYKKQLRDLIVQGLYEAMKKM